MIEKPIQVDGHWQFPTRPDFWAMDNLRHVFGDIYIDSVGRVMSATDTEMTITSNERQYSMVIADAGFMVTMDGHLVLGRKNIYIAQLVNLTTKKFQRTVYHLDGMLEVHRGNQYSNDRTAFCIDAQGNHGHVVNYLLAGPWLACDDFVAFYNETVATYDDGSWRTADPDALSSVLRVVFPQSPIAKEVFHV